MTKYFVTTFTNSFTGEEISISKKVIDSVEPRAMHKKATAESMAVRDFEKDRKRYCYNEKTGKPIIIWRVKTRETGKDFL